jgi:hypothetical protein
MMSNEEVKKTREYSIEVATKLSLEDMPHKSRDVVIGIARQQAEEHGLTVLRCNPLLIDSLRGCIVVVKVEVEGRPHDEVVDLIRAAGADEILRVLNMLVRMRVDNVMASLRTMEKEARDAQSFLAEAKSVFARVDEGTMEAEKRVTAVANIISVGARLVPAIEQVLTFVS